MIEGRGSRRVTWLALSLLAASCLLFAGPGTTGAAHGKKCAAKRAGSANAAGKRTCSRKQRGRHGLASARAIVAPVADAPATTGPGPQKQEQSPGRRISPLAKCELVLRGPCDIYTDRFWELQAAYADEEIGFAAYPVSPECGKVCAAVEYYLYPDGTLGSSTWAVDPCVPAGWRILYWPYDGPTCIQEPHLDPTA